VSKLPLQAPQTQIGIPLLRNRFPSTDRGTALAHTCGEPREIQFAVEYLAIM
jgi:hypothetical protein